MLLGLVRQTEPESRPPPWETSPEACAFACAFETRAFPCALETCAFACAFSVPENRVPLLMAENDPFSPPSRESRVRGERRARPQCACKVIPLKVCPDLNQAQGLARETLEWHLPVARPSGYDSHRHGGYRGVRMGEANNPGPPATGLDTPEPPRAHAIFRLAQGDEPARQCKIRLSPQGGV